MKNSNWTKEETIIAFNVYCKIPFKSSSKTNPIIIKYANLLGRTPSALNMKIGNFGRLDPELKKQGITGLIHGSKLEEEVWNEFYGNWDDLSYESERLIADYMDESIDKISTINSDNLPQGEDRETIIKRRVNQSFFRSAVLASYNLKCCVTGLSIPDLLTACHIKPWTLDEKNRTNPHNGLCLNELHHKAFDKGYFTISPNYDILVSNYLKDFLPDSSIYEYFIRYDGNKIHLPDKFLPSKEFLSYHYEEVFKK